MGTVYAATHEGLERDVALKVIAPQLADDDDFRARFTREARALAALDSPHVIRVFDHGDVDGHLYIATQLVRDGDLGSLLEARGALPLRAAVDLLAQVATGLSDAHVMGIVHRDIKPANVLVRVDPDGLTAFVADFGIARRLRADQAATTRTVGTPSYMAPELHTGGTPGVASDVYSLGCLLWATVTGAAPYAGTSDFEVVRQHLEAPVPQLVENSPLAREVNRVLRKAMAKNPADRYPSALAYRDDVAGVLHSMPADPGGQVAPTQIRPPVGDKTVEPSGRVPRSRRTPSLVAAAVLLIAVVGGAVWWVVADPTGDDRARPEEEQTSTSADPTPSTPDSPSATGPTSVPPGDRTKAIATVTRSLESQGIEAAVAACAAKRWVDAVGVPRMVEAGVLTEDLDVNTEDLGGETDQEVLAAGTTATVTCLSQ